jgi:hypothetical protein
MRFLKEEMGIPKQLPRRSLKWTRMGLLTNIFSPDKDK